eukprot:302630_1
MEPTAKQKQSSFNSVSQFIYGRKIKQQPKLNRIHRSGFEFCVKCGIDIEQTNLKTIRSYTLQKYLVYGFIREIHNLFSQNKAYFMPVSLKNLCFDYFLVWEEWDPLYIGKSIQCNGSIIKTTAMSWYTGCYGKQIIGPNTIISWTIKLIKFGGYGNLFNSRYGIIRDDGENMKVLSDFNPFYDNEQGYAFTASMDHQINPGYKRYGEEFNKCGSIMKIILDTVKWTLSFNINGNDYGVAFKNIKKQNYRLCVLLLQRNTEIELVESNCQFF